MTIDLRQRQTIARICHEVNRVYCKSLGDDSQLPWDEAPDWQRASCIQGVAFVLADARHTPEHSHVNWLAHKDAEGWTYGPVKDPEKKEHPCFVSYNKLPAAQQLKDAFFHGVCRAAEKAIADGVALGGGAAL